MTEQPSNSNRRFTIFELVAYVSAIGVLFGVVGPIVRLIIAKSQWNPPHAVLVAITLGIPFLFGAIVGLGVGMLVGGRRWAVSGAVLGGGMFVIMAMFVVAFVAVYSKRFVDW